MNAPTIRQALKDATRRLAPIHDTARLDAEVLLAFVLSRSRAWLHTWPEHLLENIQAQHFTRLVDRRAIGEPIAHLTGRREFWSLELEVSDRTLIPRPETETLVEQALTRIPVSASCHIADLGTGTGAIALAIAIERPACSILAIDRSAPALQVARRNAKRLQLSNVDFIQGNWGNFIAAESLGFILSNPPYVAEGDPHLTQGDVRYEPVSALVSGMDGLAAIREIIRTAGRTLTKDGLLFIEHSDSQASRVGALMKDSGFIDVDHHRDGLGQLRVTTGRWSLNPHFSPR